MRLLVVHLPSFRLERCGYQPDDLAGLIAEEKSAMRVQALTPAAIAAGIRPFMTATEARALAPEVELLPWEPEEERRDRSALVQQFKALSDRVRAPWPDTLVLDVSGTAHLFGGEEGLVARAESLAARLGHDAVALVVDEALAGRALARWGRRGVVAAGEGAAALARLPLRALEPSLGLLRALQSVGIDQIGAFARLQPPAVSSRFGDEGARLHRVARGQAVGTVDWGEADEQALAVSVAMGGATTTLQLHFVLPGLLAQLSDRLADQGLAAIRLRVVLRLEQHGDAEPVLGLGVTVGRPTREPATLERLIRTRLEGQQLAAPVDELRIEVSESTPELGWQPGLTDRVEATEPLPDLLARLADVLGDEAVCGAALVDRWRPEAAWEPAPWPPRRRFDVARVAPDDDPVLRQQAAEAPSPRPLLLAPRPAPVRVRVGPDGAPVAWRTEESWRRLDRSEGPERLRSEWWSAERWARDYWVIQDGDVCAWVYRELTRAAPAEGGEQTWFVHGHFD
jgi:protein ImuB